MNAGMTLPQDANTAELARLIRLYYIGGLVAQTTKSKNWPARPSAPDISSPATALSMGARTWHYFTPTYRGRRSRRHQSQRPQPQALADAKKKKPAKRLRRNQQY